MREVPSYRLVTAGLILIAYFAVSGILLSRVLGASPALQAGTWEQVIVIFNAVGAIATTAAGVLFGAEIQQANVRDARGEAQREAANAAKTREAAMQALESLEGSSAAAADGGGASLAARALLRRVLT